MRTTLNADRGNTDRRKNTFATRKDRVMAKLAMTCIVVAIIAVDTLAIIWSEAI
ncbi:MAG: hypothetical protein IJ785_02365 [Bacteroidales bacterium]|nr:hypothetical protein [Bacteroidales bacterium]